MAESRKSCIASLRKAFSQKNLTLYLGAGVSVGNGLPTWERLVLAMYFAAISVHKMQGWRPFPNYLFAIAEWHMKRGHEPLEITARKLKKYFSTPDDFLHRLRNTLYQGFMQSDGETLQRIGGSALREANATLDAVAQLCEGGGATGHGASAVISYNYDSLLETALRNCPNQPIFGEAVVDASKLPIYHVHGYVPIEAGEGSSAEEIVFTEDQYHRTAQDVYSWGNLVQIQAMARSVGLMVGLSMSDRNMRRLLDAIAKAPIGTRNYALLQRREWSPASYEEIDEIQEKALEYFDRFERSGVKSDSRARNKVLARTPGTKSASPLPKIGAGVKGEARYRREIRGILGEIERFDTEEQEFVLDQLGITPIWYQDHAEIPRIVEKIIGN